MHMSRYFENLATISPDTPEMFFDTLPLDTNAVIVCRIVQRVVDSVGKESASESTRCNWMLVAIKLLHYRHINLSEGTADYFLWAAPIRTFLMKVISSLDKIKALRPKCLYKPDDIQSPRSNCREIYMSFFSIHAYEFESRRICREHQRSMNYGVKTGVVSMQP